MLIVDVSPSTFVFLEGTENLFLVNPPISLLSHLNPEDFFVYESFPNNTIKSTKIS